MKKSIGLLRFAVHPGEQEVGKDLKRDRFLQVNDFNNET